MNLPTSFQPHPRDATNHVVSKSSSGFIRTFAIFGSVSRQCESLDANCRAHPGVPISLPALPRYHTPEEGDLAVREPLCEALRRLDRAPHQLWPSSDRRTSPSVFGVKFQS
jgi:hypothetical protein